MREYVSMRERALLTFAHKPTRYVRLSISITDMALIMMGILWILRSLYATSEKKAI